MIVVGSQSVLGTWDEFELPGPATLSNEADILAMDADNELVKQLADQLEGAAGELSQFDSTHGFHLDGVDQTTAVLPAGWRDRLVPVSNSNTNYCTGWCLEPHDLCVAKLTAHREKDTLFVQSLIQHGLIDPATVVTRLDSVADCPPSRIEAARSWLGLFR